MDDLRPYRMTCPHCRSTLKFGIRAIGKEKECPGCKHPVVVQPDELPNPGHDFLRGVVRKAKCRVVGWEDAGNDAHRQALAALIQGFGSDSTILCEPSLARKAKHPPDIVLIDPMAGVHVVEVKGMALEQVKGIDAGGQFRIRYQSRLDRKKPLHQVQQAMFAIKDSVGRMVPGSLYLPFEVWVVMPRITRSAWMEKWGPDAFCPEEFLFADDLEPTALVSRLVTAGQTQLAKRGLKRCPKDQLDCVLRAFGDSCVLYPSPEDRRSRTTQEDTLGKRFDEAAEQYKALSEDQERLCMQDWGGAPRLIRGVAGSGKTIVLATNVARRYHRQTRQQPDLFEPQPKPRLLCVCYNQLLVPFIRQKIEIAYKHRSGESLPSDGIDVFHLNGLMHAIAKRGVWGYQRIWDKSDATRAKLYLDRLLEVKANKPDLFDGVAYDAIYVDEGQDFFEEDFQLLRELCRTAGDDEPNLYIFYDDAQNLYGRSRPNWQSLGINVRGGRSHIMTECFRNTRQIVEPAFNVLYGSFADTPGQGPTKEYSDLRTLEERGLVRNNDGIWQVRFARRQGMPPCVTFAKSEADENHMIMARLRYLIEEQQVRPQDIQVLAFQKQRARELARLIGAAKLPSIAGVHLAIKDKKQAIGRPGHLSVSTVASAKGYDAYCVLLASANKFNLDLTGRVSFYVACTRAIEYLEIFAYQRGGLALEMESAVSHMTATAAPRPGSSM